ncbi:unnamed protein product [Ambrosiozyma monospora]|uniref:Unnamed protein product n=1 Tax=Ambrosiozyma monospora TaxID=43982 RepID=A0A9W6Z382_AMBMO|nr:unnamed protein product [Ambrosiozyma monospora]
MLNTTIISNSTIDSQLKSIIEQWCPQLLQFDSKLKASILNSPLWIWALLYVSVVLLVINFYFSRVVNVCKLIPGENTAEFEFEFESDQKQGKSTRTRKKLSIAGLIDLKIPEFRNNALSIFNPFFIGGHLQTMFAAVRTFRFSDQLYFGRRVILFEDGGSASLDMVITRDSYESTQVSKTDIPEGQHELSSSTKTRYFTKQELKEQDISTDDTPILIILHGLSGSSAESYCRCVLSRACYKYGFQGYVLNSRGCGETELTSPSLFCGLWTDDLREVIRNFKKTQPQRDIYVAGFSLGSSILGNYLTQEGENSGIKLAVMLASLWDLSTSCAFMSSSFLSNNLYLPAMTVPLVKLCQKHYKMLSKNPNFVKNFTKENLNKVYRLKDFDDLITSKIFGFNCGNEYYRTASSRNGIFKIRTPVISIGAEDDPIIGGDSFQAIPYDEASLNPFITLINTSLGGHCAWFKWNNERWYAEPLAKLFSEFHLRCKSDPIVKKEELPVENKFKNGRLVGPYF